MSKLSKEQIKELDGPITKTMREGVELMCDGYRISLRDRLIGRQVRTQLFVNNHVLGKWFVNPEDHAESKFYMPYVRYMKKSARSKKKEKVDLGMRRPDFASIGQALRHLNTVCDSVEVIEENDCE